MKPSQKTICIIIILLAMSNFSKSVVLAQYNIRNLYSLSLEPFLNMKDDQVLINKADNNFPPIVTFNPFVSDLRKIGPINQHSTQNENVTLYTPSKKKKNYLMSIPEVSNNLDNEAVSLSLNYIEQAIDNKLLCKESYDALLPLKEYLSTENQNTFPIDFSTSISPSTAFLKHGSLTNFFG